MNRWSNHRRTSVIDRELNNFPAGAIVKLTKAYQPRGFPVPVPAGEFAIVAWAGNTQYGYKVKCHVIYDDGRPGPELWLLPSEVSHVLPEERSFVQEVIDRGYTPEAIDRAGLYINEGAPLAEQSDTDELRVGTALNDAVPGGLVDVQIGHVIQFPTVARPQRPPETALDMLDALLNEFSE